MGGFESFAVHCFKHLQIIIIIILIKYRLSLYGFWLSFDCCLSFSFHLRQLFQSVQCIIWVVWSFARNIEKTSRMNCWQILALDLLLLLLLLPSLNREESWKPFQLLFSYFYSKELSITCFKNPKLKSQWRWCSTFHHLFCDWLNWMNDWMNESLFVSLCWKQKLLIKYIAETTVFFHCLKHLFHPVPSLPNHPQFPISNLLC